MTQPFFFKHMFKLLDKKREGNPAISILKPSLICIQDNCPAGTTSRVDVSTI